MTLRLSQCSCLEKELQSCQSPSKSAVHPSFYSDNLVADIGSSDEDWFEVATRQLVNVTIPASQKLDATVIASPHLSQVNHLVSGRQLCPKPSLEQATADDVQLQAPKNVLRNTSTPLSQRQPMGSQTDDSDSYRDFFQKVSAPGIHGSSSNDSKDVLNSPSLCLLTPISNTESVELLHLEENTTRDTVGSSVNIGIPVNSSPNGSEYSWSSSMETPPGDNTKTPGDTSQGFTDGEALQTRPKGLPRALFSPNHNPCDAEELVRCLDTTMDEDLHDKVSFLQNTHVNSASETTTSTFTSFNDVSDICNKSSVLHASRDSIISEVLSDFSDTPSQWKKKRKPKPTKGKKRKAVEKIEKFSVDILSPIKNSSFRAENTTLRSILSAGKKTKPLTPNTCKRVRFVKNVDFDDDSDKSCHPVDSKTDSKEDSTSVSVNNAKDISQTVSNITENDVKCTELFLSSESAKNKDAMHNNLCKSVSAQIVPQRKIQEETITDVYGDMFSQLSPQSLQSMCKVDEVTVQYAEVNVCFPEAVRELEKPLESTKSAVICSQFSDVTIDEQTKNFTSDNTDNDVFTQISPSAMDKIFTATDSINIGHLDNVKYSDVPCESKYIGELTLAAKDNPGTEKDVSVVKDSGRDNSLPTPASEQSAKVKGRDVAMPTTVKRKLSLGCAGKRFLYPSKMQIGVSCPKTVFNFKSSISPKSVSVPVAKQSLTDDKPNEKLTVTSDENCHDADWEERDVKIPKPVFRQKHSDFQKFSTMKLEDDVVPADAIVKKNHYAKPHTKRSQENNVTGDQCMARSNCHKMPANNLIIGENSATTGDHDPEDFSKAGNAMVVESEKLDIDKCLLGFKSIPPMVSVGPFCANLKVDCEAVDKHSITSYGINNATEPDAPCLDREFSSFGGFSTAKGKTIIMSENAIDKAKKLLLDEVNDDDNMDDAEWTDGVENSEKACRNDNPRLTRTDEDNAIAIEKNCTGFSTVSGKTIDVSTKAMIKAQTVISSVDEKKMDLSFGGFQTAKGNRVNISENGLLKAKSLMADIDMSDYETSKSSTTEQGIGKHELKLNNSNMGENTFSKHSNNILDTDQKSISKENESIKDYPSFSGFQTATGNEVHISEESLCKESLCKAEALMIDVDDDGIVCRDISPCKPKSIKIRECLKNTTANISVSKSVNSAARTGITERDLSKIPKGFRPFKAPRISALPKKKSEDDNSTLDIQLQTSKDSLMECSDQAFDDSLLMELMADELTETSGFDQDTNNTVKFSETGIISEEKLIRQNGTCMPNEFSTQFKGATADDDVKVSGTKPEDISKHGKETMTCHDMPTADCDLSDELFAFKSVVTKQNDLKRKMAFANNGQRFHDVDAHKMTSVSDHELPSSDSNLGLAIVNEFATKDCVTANDPLLEICGNNIKNVNLAQFQTALGKSVDVSHEALQQAKKHFHDETATKFTDNGQKNTLPTSNPKISLFQTASGKSVSVSVKALLKAKQICIDENDKIRSFSSVSDDGKSISDETIQPFEGIALEQGKNILNNTKTISVVSNSEDAGIKTKPFLDAQLRINKNTLISTEIKNVTGKNSSSMFQTASGNNVYVSKESLQKARNTWSAEDSISPSPDLGQGGGNTNIVMLEHSDNTSLASNKPESSMFQTASGKNVHVSEEALKQAKSWGDDDMINDNDDMINDNKGPKFQTAFCKNVHESDSAMKNVKQTMNAETGGKLSENSFIGINKNEDLTSSLFQTARGGKVTVSPASLEAAKDAMHEELSLKSKESKVSLFQTASGKHVEVSPASLEAAKDAMHEELSLKSKESKVSLFQTASGKHVEVSPASLDAAKEAMHEELSLKSKESKVSLFQTASGKHVEVSENALNQSRKSLYDSCKEPTKSNSCLTNRRITPSAVKQQLPQAQSLFQTASGRSVAVSEKALERTKELFDDKPKQATNSLSPMPVSSSKSTSKVPEHNRQSIVCTDNTSHSFRKSIKNSSSCIEILQKKMKPRDSVAANEIPTSLSDSPPMDLDDSEVGKGHRMPNRVPRTADAQGVTDKTDMFQRKRKAMYTQPEVYFKDRISKSEKRLKPMQCQDLFQNKCSNPRSLLAALLPSDTSKSPQPSNFRTPYKPKSTAVSTVSPESTKTTIRTPRTPVWSKSESIRTSLEVNIESKPTTSEASAPEPILLQESSILSAEQNKACIFDANQLQKLCATQDDIINKKKKVKIRPALGQLLNKKLSCSRFKLSELFCPQWPTKRSADQIQASGLSRGPVSMTSLNAAGFRFDLSEYYCDSLQQVIVGDGALLVPDDAGFVGKDEVYRSFLTIDSVDPILVSEAWLDNHYRWIVWKLAGYEMSCPQLWAGRCLTPEMLMLQMKYRYDREIDRCERPALRKIIEKDDTPSKRLVLCVSYVIKAIPTKDTDQQEPQAEQVMLELTDGWYSIKASLDPMLTRLVQNRLIRTGQKLCISGSELLGSEEACSPLEAPASLMLKLTGNSTRPARWDAKLGFQLNPQPFVVPLSSLQGDGGSVSCIDAIITRIYPQMYMEKCHQGPCVFRCARAEERVAKMYTQSQEHRMEKLYAKVESDFEKEENKDIRRPSGRGRKWNSQAIEKLQTGQEIYEALQSSLEPDVIQNQLSSFQLLLLCDYRQQLNEDRRQSMHARFQSRWKEAEESNPPRTVIPLIKMHLAGCCRADVDNKKGAMLTIWRASEELLSVLKEGRRYKVTGLSASVTRTRYPSKDIQLSASRNSRFVETPVDENFLDLIYEPREVLMVRDLSNNSEGNTQVDFVGTVVKIVSKEVGDSGKLLDIAYMVDSNGDIVLAKFWGGLKTFSLEDVVDIGCAVACRNLLLKAGRRSSVPSLDANTEMSVFTRNPQDPMLNAALSKHRVTTKGISNFLDSAREKVQQIIQGGWNSRSQFAQHAHEQALGAANHNHNVNYSSSMSFQEENSISCSNNPPLSEENLARKVLNTSKTDKLLSYGPAPPLANLQNPIPNTVRCDFRPPRQDKAL